MNFICFFLLFKIWLRTHEMPATSFLQLWQPEIPLDIARYALQTLPKIVHTCAHTHAYSHIEIHCSRLNRAPYLIELLTSVVGMTFTLQIGN